MQEKNKKLFVRTAPLLRENSPNTPVNILKQEDWNLQQVQRKTTVLDYAAHFQIFFFQRFLNAGNRIETTLGSTF